DGGDDGFPPGGERPRGARSHRPLGGPLPPLPSRGPHAPPLEKKDELMIYDDIAQTIGRTPVVRINHLAPKHVRMYVKLEAANPGGSVKDRLALGIIEEAERRGELRPGQTVVRATSGKTGIPPRPTCARR